MARGQTEARIEITPDDRELFKLLFMWDVMTFDQVRRIRYYEPVSGRLTTARNVSSRLSRLTRARYLRGQWLNTTWGRRRGFVLGERSLLELRRVVPKIQQASLSGRVPLHQIEHALMVTECACRLVESLRDCDDVEVPSLEPLGLPFYSAYTVGVPSARRHEHRFVTHHQGVRPDLVFALRDAVGRACRLFFVEVDRGTEGVAKIEQKLWAYSAYSTAADAPHRHYGTDIDDIRVLFVASSRRRIHSIRDRLSSNPGFSLLAMAVAEDLFGSAKNFVLDPVWMVPDGSWRPLIRRAPVSGTEARCAASSD